MWGFDSVQRGNYYRGEAIRRTEAEVSVGNVKNGKAASKRIRSLERKWWAESGGFVI